jgi:2-phospho-L-lactate guanylyltransferase
VTGLTWTVLMPVKRLPAAKTRLRGAVPAAAHQRLVLALACDTAAAAVACPVVGRVVVVTSDPTARAALADVGADVVADLPDAGLNQAIAYGATVARPRTPTAAMPGLAALAADLPALRPAELTAALRAAADLAGPRMRGYVPDAAGTGTVLLAAPPGLCLEPCFGPGSAAAHAASGAVALEGVWPGLRRDVDTPADLEYAAALGIGAHTSAALAGYGVLVQGTVASFDEAEHNGLILLDDGSPVEFPAAAFDASGLRLLRVGQRVRLDRDESGAIVKITLPTMS